MTAERFGDWVMLQERPGLSKGSLAFAADFFVSQQQTHGGDLKSCIELAGSYEVSSPIIETATGGTQAFSISITPAALITSEKWARDLHPWVEGVRQEIFGSPLPPFRTYEDAVRSLYIFTGVTTPCVSSAEIHVQNIACAMPTGGTFKCPQATIQINWGKVPPQPVQRYLPRAAESLEDPRGKAIHRTGPTAARDGQTPGW